MSQVQTKPKTSFAAEKLKAHFPILQRKINGHPLVYLDNASTTQKPKVVTDKLLDYYQVFNANIHRGVYQMSQEATAEYEETREMVKDFINATSSKEIIFTRNTTESINLIAHSFGTFLQKGDEILLTEMEHHSNLVPWQLLAQQKELTLRFIPVNLDGRLVLTDLDSFITPKTKLVSLTHVSNVLGAVNPIKKIASTIKKLNPNTVILVDGAQAVGHMKVDVQDLGVDFYAFSAHKMLGPTGVGVLWGREKLLEKMPPFLSGGEMIKAVSFQMAEWNDLPWKFEAGTPNIADVVAFKTALQFLEKIGWEHIQDHEKELTSYTLEKLAAFPNLRLYGPRDLFDRAGVISFNLGKIHSHDVASILDSRGICIRSGHHCAQPLLNRLGVSSAARVSVYLYNTKDDIDQLVASLRQVEETIK